MKRGLFIVFEGPDGSGKGSQMNKLHDYIKELSKYNDVLTTHEPWGNDEIKRILREEKDAYSSAEKVLELFVKDRKNHLENLIKPALEKGVFVICDRYALSTFAYQSAQGVDLECIKRKHEETNLIKPDITYLLSVGLKTALERIGKRGDPKEKFEEEQFMQKVINNYSSLGHSLGEHNWSSLGKIEMIDGEMSKEHVFEKIKKSFGEEFFEKDSMSSVRPTEKIKQDFPEFGNISFNN